MVALGGQRVAAARCDAHRRTQALRKAAAGLGHRRRDRRGMLAGLPRALGPQPGFPFRGCRAAQRIRPPANGIRPLLGGADHQPCFHFGGSRGFSRRDRCLALRGRGVEQRCLLGVGQTLFELGEFVNGLPATGLQLVALADQPLPLLVGRAGVLPEPAQLFVDRRDRGVGLVERGQRLLGGVLTGLLFRQRTGQRGAQLVGLFLRGGQLVSGLLHLGGDLQRAGLAVRTAADPARADQIAVGGDGTQLRARGHQIQRRRQIADHHYPGQHRRERAAQPPRHFDQVRRPQRAFWRWPGRCGRIDGPVAEHDRRAAAVGCLQRRDGRTRSAEVLGGDGIGRCAHDRRDCRLVTRAHPDQIGDRAEKSCPGEVFLQPRGAVLAVKTDGKGVDAGT